MRVEKLNFKDVFPTFNINQLDELIQMHLKGNQNDYKQERGSIEKNLAWSGENYDYAKNCSFRKIRFSHRNIIEPIYERLCDELYEKLNCNNVEVRAFLHYRPKDYMGWHSNWKSEGVRYYLTWAEEDNKSFFNYYESGQVIKVPDKKGWCINRFNINKDNLLHHSVECNTNRFSLGLRVL